MLHVPGDTIFAPAFSVGSSIGELVMRDASAEGLLVEGRGTELEFVGVGKGGVGGQNKHDNRLFFRLHGKAIIAAINAWFVALAVAIVFLNFFSPSPGLVHACTTLRRC